MEHTVYETELESSTLSGAFMRTIVCSQQRTGSNMLRSALESHSDLRVGGEAATRVSKSTHERWWAGWSDAPISPYVNSSMCHEHMQYVWHHLDVWNIHDAPMKCDPFHRTMKKYADLHVVWLSRQDVVAQALSLAVAMESKRWCVPHDGNNTTAGRFRVSPTHVLRLAQHFKQLRSYTKRTLQGKPSILVTYEQLVDDFDDTLNDVQKFLGVKSMELRPTTKKTHDKSMSELVVNYDEVMRYARAGLCDSA